MKTKILSLVVASMLLTSAANAAQGFVGIGYGSASIDGSDSQAAGMLEFGTKFGEDFRHTIAMKYIFVAENDSWNNDAGSIGDIYYALGYEVLPSTVLSAKVGLGFQSLGTVRSGRSTTSAYSLGVSYGAIATYEISDSFDISASYTQMNLSYTDLDYKLDSMDVSIAYKF